MGLTRVWNGMFGDQVKAAYNTGFSGTAEAFTHAMTDPNFENYRASLETEKGWGPRKHALIDGAFDAYKDEGRIGNVQILLSAELNLFNASQRPEYYDSHRDYKVMRKTQDLLSERALRNDLNRETVDLIFEKSMPADKKAFLSALTVQMLFRRDVQSAIALVAAGAIVSDKAALLYQAANIPDFTPKTATALLGGDTPEQVKTALSDALLIAVKERNLDVAKTLLSVGASAEHENSKSLQDAASLHQTPMMRLLLDHGASFEHAIYDAAARAQYDTFKSLQVYQVQMTGKKTVLDIAPDKARDSKDDTIAALQEQIAKLTERIGKLEQAAQPKDKASPSLPRNKPAL